MPSLQVLEQQDSQVRKPHLEQICMDPLPNREESHQQNLEPDSGEDFLSFHRQETYSEVLSHEPGLKCTV